MKTTMALVIRDGKRVLRTEYFVHMDLGKEGPMSGLNPYIGGRIRGLARPTLARHAQVLSQALKNRTA